MTPLHLPASSPAAVIAELNDKFRNDETTAYSRRFLHTQGIAALPLDHQVAIHRKVANFNDFEDGDDPYAERDLGAFEHNGERIFWKIDYYDPSIEHGSEDPGDPAKTVRVLTIMLASEY